MSPLLYARAQMGLSLAFHIVFAAAGIALPLLMVIADALWMRTRDPDYRELRQRLAKGTSVLFAVGAVSGTVLSFELGLLWPSFMGTFGSVIGIPFALEGFAFFTEAIFLGIYLYGRDRVSERLHLFAGVVVAVSGAASAVFVTLVNAFMNLPAGLQIEGGKIVAADPLAAMWSPSWPHQSVHVLLSSYQATAFAMVGIHAFLLLRGRRPAFHRKALRIALPVAIVTALVQPISGDRSAKQIAHLQPLKLAAAEAHFESRAHAPLLIGGLADVDTRRVPGAIPLPGGLSFLAFGDFDAPVQGLDGFPSDEWPPVAKVHLAFDTMVGTGTAMAGLAALVAFLAVRRRRWPDQRWVLWSLVAAAPLGFVALEAGWLVTEWGRQPWLVHGVLRTEAAMTAFPYKAAPFWLFTVLYVFLAATVVYLLGHQIAATRDEQTGKPTGKPASLPEAAHAAD